MMLSRTALRLAVIEALAPYALHAEASPAWPTLAGKQIVDSQISAAAMTEIDRLSPLVVVYTDDTAMKADGSDPTLSHSSTPLQVTLAFEIMVPVAVSNGDAAPSVQEIGPTDAATEAMLDLIEEQIHQRIADARMTGPLVHVLAMIVSVESLGYRDGDTETRLSARRLEYVCQVRRAERWPATLPADPQPFDYLPAPMAQVARALPVGSYGHKVATMLGSLIGRPATFPALNEMRLAVNLARAAGDPAPPEPDASQEAPIGDIGGSVAL